MKKHFITFILFLFFISSCSVKTEAKETLIPEPTPTPTRIPLSEIDLEGMLIMDGDLPAGYSGAQIRATAPKIIGINLPDSQYQIYQELAKDGQMAGGISVYLYESTENIENAYVSILDGFSDPIDLKDIGEKAAYHNTFVISRAGLVFIRCNAVVEIDMRDLGFSDDPLFGYAKRLDKRLTEIVCP